MVNDATAQEETSSRRSLWRWRALTNRLRLLPDFIIIGVQRGGTTSLYNYLVEHPHIAPAARKEVSFFDRHFEQGLTWYRAHFVSLLHRCYAKRVRRRDLITGESSPYYIFHPLIPRRVARLLPHVKLIALLRDPVDRAYSHYWHMVRLGHETLSFEETIEREAERLRGERERLLEDEKYHSFNHRRYSYLLRGIYVDQLEDWERFFPREQILLLCSEDFYADPAAGLRQVFEFLNVPNWELEAYRRYNQASYARMDPATRKRLIDYFNPHNERLYTYLGRRFSWGRGG